MRTSRSLPTVACLVLMTVSAPALADPVVITGGVVTTDLPPPPQGARLDLVGTPDSAFGIRWGEPVSVSAATCRPCMPGAVVFPTARFFDSTIPSFGAAFVPISGSATVNGVHYALPFVSFNGDLTFGGLGASLPAVALAPGDAFTLNLPFVFGGVLNGFDIFRQETLLLFSTELDGAGNGNLLFRGSPSGAYEYVSSTYTFTPTPEPGTFTLVLLSGGAAVLLLRTRSARRLLG